MLRQRDLARGFCSNKNAKRTATRMSSQSHGLEPRRMATKPVNAFNPTHVSRNSPSADEGMEEGMEEGMNERLDEDGFRQRSEQHTFDASHATAPINDVPTACRHHTAHHCRSGTETVSLVREATCHVRTIRN